LEVQINSKWKQVSTKNREDNRGIDTFADLDALVGPYELVAPRSSGYCTGASLITRI
jgi:hypothetical protein